MTSRRSAVALALMLLTVLVALLVVETARGTVPARWKPPAWWLAQAACIRSHEGWWTANTGNGYYGAYQFLLGTWRGVGGTGYPHQASPREQTYRAWLLWLRSGRSWSQWGPGWRCS